MVHERDFAAEREARIRSLIDMLGTSGDCHVFRELNELSPDWRESQVAQEVADHWLAVLLHQHGGERAKALEVLNAIEDSRAAAPAMSTLYRFAATRDERLAGIKVLGTTRHVPALDALLAWLDCPDVELQREVVKALGKLQDPRAAPAVLELLPGADDSTQLAIVEALGTLHDRRAVPALTELLSGADGYLRGVIVRTLGAIGGDQATDALLQVLEFGALDEMPGALRALRQLGWEPENRCREALAAIAECQWQRLLLLGPVAFEPLLRAIRSKLYDSHRPQEMLGILEALVERSGSELGGDDLRSCTGLEDLEVTRIEIEYDEKDSPIGRSTHTSTVSTARLRELAQRELDRRAGDGP